MHTDRDRAQRAAMAAAALVTDSTPATGAGPGRFTMAGVVIDQDGRLADGRLAGSVLTLDAAVRNWDALTGATLAEALFAASEATGLTTGCTARAPADLVLVGDGGDLRAVMRGGRWTRLSNA